MIELLSYSSNRPCPKSGSTIDELFLITDFQVRSCCTGRWPGPSSARVFVLDIRRVWPECVRGLTLNQYWPNSSCWPLLATGWKTSKVRRVRIFRSNSMLPICAANLCYKFAPQIYAINSCLKSMCATCSMGLCVELDQLNA